MFIGMRATISVPFHSILSGKASSLKLLGVNIDIALPETITNSPCKPSDTIFILDEIP